MASKIRFCRRKCNVKEEKLQPGICVMGGIVSDVECLGQLCTTSHLTVHGSCWLFNPLLLQLLSPDIKRRGYIIGFKMADIEHEIKRITRLCSKVCHDDCAGVGCTVNTCNISFHLSCGLNNVTLGIFKDCFQFYCSDHALSQDLNDRLKSCEQLVPDCTICLSSMVDDGYEEICNIKRSGTPWSQFLKKIQERSVIHGECCARCWIHRGCMRKYALSAGLHHTKCPNCSDTKKFLDVIQQYGIWLPDRDASWELEPGAFHELYDNPGDVTDDMESENKNNYNKSGVPDSLNIIDLTNISSDGDSLFGSSTNDNFGKRYNNNIIQPVDILPRKRQRPLDWSLNISPTSKRRQKSNDISKENVFIKMCSKCFNDDVECCHRVTRSRFSVLNDSNKKQDLLLLESKQGYQCTVKLRNRASISSCLHLNERNILSNIFFTKTSDLNQINDIKLSTKNNSVYEKRILSKTADVINTRLHGSKKNNQCYKSEVVSLKTKNITGKKCI